ncbi:MAG: hypothetical protein H6817_08925 [Phycisphaerales bacterium]|nr:hypothetical protein [Phycisphaerales bacterium]
MNHALRRSLLFLLVGATGATPAFAGQPRYRVYKHNQAQRAVEEAQRRCKPLIVHIVPNERDGAGQIQEYYGPRSRIPRYELDRVVVVVIPRDRYEAFAESLGVHEAGGMRALDPYDFSFTDGWGITTTVERVEWVQGFARCGRCGNSSAGEMTTRTRYTSPQSETSGAPDDEDGEGERATPNRPRRLTDPDARDANGVNFNNYRDELSPRIVRKYFRDVTWRFEQFAQQRYLEPLADPNSGETVLLAGLSYVTTRQATVPMEHLKGIFNSRRSGDNAKLIYDLCLDAILANTEDPTATVDFLAYVGSLPDPPPGEALCREGLGRLQPEANYEMLEFMNRTTDKFQRARLAGLLERVSGVTSPEPVEFWRSADPEAAATAIEAWRSAIIQNALAEP